MSDEDVRVPASTTAGVLQHLFSRAGLGEADAATMAGALVEADR